VPVLLQLDQHDFAVKNRLTMAEHRHRLDVPSWDERPQSHIPFDVAAELVAAVR
jgi:hypothetical protein